MVDSPAEPRGGRGVSGERSVASSVAAPWSTQELLRRLLQETTRGTHLRHVDLDSLCEQLHRLDSTRLARVEELTASLHPALEALVAGIDATGHLDKRRRAHLRTLLRRIHCVLDSTTRDHEVAPELLDVRYGEVDLAGLVRTVCAPFAPLAQARSLNYAVHTPPQLSAQVDPAKIEAALTTLLFNAFKQTPERGQVHCSLDVDARDEQVLLCVSDSGPTIPPGASEALFDHWRESDRGSVLRLGGIVLSLGTARDFVALHGGSLVVVQRSTFRVRVPQHAPFGVAVDHAPAERGSLAEAAAAVAASELSHEADLGSAKVERNGRAFVLIVGSNRSIHRVIAASLDAEYDLAYAFDGVEGLRRAVELRPDLIVVDVGAPGVTDARMIQAIRARADLQRVAILVLLGAGDPMQQVELLEGGAQDVLRKPLLLPELRARVRNLVSTQRALAVLNAATAHHESDLVKLAAQVARDQQELRTALDGLRIARELAENASRIKSNFLRMVSHELKTPITALQLHLKLIERESGLDVNPRIREGMDHVARASTRLLHLVDTVLEWARVESGRCEVALETFQLGQVVSEVAHDLRGYAVQKGVDLCCTVRGAPMADVTTDPRLVRLILVNLVTRAIQVTERGSVEIESLHAEGKALVRVHDRGPLIRADERAEIFEPLGSDRDLRWREGGGSGLGMSVVRDIARALDADIQLHVVAGRGNTFSLELPDLVPEQRETGIFARPGAVRALVQGEPWREEMRTVGARDPRKRSR
jgi:signal transduction histidine kinase